MGTDILPRWKRMQRYSLHFTAGGGDDAANIILFAGAEGSVTEALKCNYGYVKKADAVKLADRLEKLYKRMKKQDIRPIMEHKATPPKMQLEELVLTMARDIGSPVPPDWLKDEMVRMLSNPYSDWTFTLPRLILISRKGGGFWWC